MVAAGESSGSLDVIMQRMSDHYAKENKLHKRTIQIAHICNSIVFLNVLY